MIVLRWRRPAKTIELRWRGKDSGIYQLIDIGKEQHIASVIGPPGHELPAEAIIAYLTEYDTALRDAALAAELNAQTAAAASQAAFDAAEAVLASVNQAKTIVETKTDEALQAAIDAATSETASASSAIVAISGKDGATFSALAAEVSATEAATSSNSAGTSATIATAEKQLAIVHSASAANSSLEAATAASNALGSAAVASSAETTAVSAKDQAAGSATASSTSETNAATSATDAANQATIAVTNKLLSEAAKEAAELAATASNISESNATTKATEAGTFASAANTSKISAEAANANATSSASVATTQSAIATAAASSASTSSDLSATYLYDTGKAVATLTPKVFSPANFVTGNTAAYMTPFPAPAPADNFSTDKLNLQVEVGVSTYGSGIWLRQAVPIKAGDVFKTIASMKNVASAGGNYSYWYHYIFDSNKTFLGQFDVYSGNTAFSMPASVHEKSLNLTGDAVLAQFPTAAYIQFGVLFNRDAGLGVKANGTRTDIYSFYAVDLTESTKAESQAAISTAQAVISTSQASSATSSSNLAASYRADSITSAVETYPYNFTNDGEFFAYLYGNDLAAGQPNSAARPEDVYTSIQYTETANGRVMRFGVNNAQGSYTHVAIRKRIPILPNIGRRLRITMACRLVTPPASASSITGLTTFYGLEADYNTLVYGGFNDLSYVPDGHVSSAVLPTNGDIVYIGLEIVPKLPVADGNGRIADYLVPSMYFYAGDGGLVGQPELIYLKYEDVTEQYKAVAQAAIATTQAATATSKAAEAAASATLSASITPGSKNKDPFLTDWLTANQLRYYSAWGGNGYITRVAGNPATYACNITSYAGQQNGQLEDTALSPGWWVIEADVTPIAGSLSGSGVHCHSKLNGTVTGQYFDVSAFTQHGAGVLNRTYRIKKLVEFTNDCNGAWIYMMGHYTPLGDSSNENTVKFSYLGIRPATQQEIDTQTILPALQASVAVNQSAIAGIDGKLAANWGVKVGAGNVITGLELIATGAGVSEIIFNASIFKFQTSGGNKTPFSVNADKVELGTDLHIRNHRIVYDNGAYMKVQGTGFGANSDLVSWYGVSQAINLCTKANAISYETTTGDAYFGGSLSAGTLKNEATSSLLANNASVIVGPFTTNGNSKSVVMSYSLSTNRTKPHPFTCPVSPVTPSATLKLERRLNGGAWTTVITSQVYNGNWQCDNSFSGSEPGNETETIAGSVTYTDTNASIDNFEYRASLISRTLNASGNPDNQKIGIVSVEQ